MCIRDRVQCTGAVASPDKDSAVLIHGHGVARCFSSTAGRNIHNSFTVGAVSQERSEIADWIIGRADDPARRI